MYPRETLRNPIEPTIYKKGEKAAIQQQYNKIPGHRDDDSSSKNYVYNFSMCQIQSKICQNLGTRFKSNFPSMYIKTTSSLLACAKFSPKYVKILEQGVNQISPVYQHQTFPVNVNKTA